ncbi:polysaccharide pyruvyl transferase family protein [Roseomonas sp. SSH11]|uniref:Polysaccharide pyruvyl transferase family protein n=1 Tax=Pararoseomonas baculiformis TaxID=2820812 RepID=A0ABS4ADH7_9PROT|nr:polysaccharide pyruvyl transferase family protein [Pararoseomonas baculiformis]MBP0445064.1 polysaccharide pyruvyl transferase family protein [Pararoseomonas baculiformis]
MSETTSLADHPTTALIFGTFDVQNYGDLLFPIIAAHRLAAHGIEVVPVSPTDSLTGLAGAPEPRRLRDASRVIDGLSERRAVAGLLIGGGNIIHNGPANLADYRQEGMFDWAYAGLWLGATLLAAIHNLPVAWNAPGVPRPLAAPLRGHVMLRQALQAADHVSVRDDASVDNLHVSPHVMPQVVPDTAAEIARVWPRAALAPAFASLLERKAVQAGGPFLTVHVKARSMERPHAEMAEQIEGFAAAHGMTPILLALGLCHGDEVDARRIGRFMRRPHIVLDDPLSLQEIAGSIAHAALHLGSSLHGYITAAAYDVPSALVARPTLAKFAGFLAHTGRTGDLAESWDDAFARAAELAKPSSGRRIPDHVFHMLDLHWARILATLNAPRQGADARARFLRGYMKRGMAGQGWDWALAPAIR